MIEQILRECCSDWESRSAGATPTSSQLDMDMQVRQYLPQCQLRIGDDDVDPATKGQEEENMIEKRVCSVGVFSGCVHVMFGGVFSGCVHVMFGGVFSEHVHVMFGGYHAFILESISRVSSLVPP